MNDSTQIQPGSVLDVFLTDYPELVKPLMDEVVKTSIALGRGEGVVIVLWKKCRHLDVIPKSEFVKQLTDAASLFPEMADIADTIHASDYRMYFTEFSESGVLVRVYNSAEKHGGAGAQPEPMMG